MKVKAAVALSTFLALAAAGAARAEVFVGGGVSSNSYEYSDLSDSTGSKIYGGYYAPGGIFGEVAFVDLGETRSDFVAAGFKASGTAGYVGYRGQLGTGLEAFGKVGVYSFDTDLIASGSTIATESGSGLAWGLGIGFALNRNAALRGELEQFVNVKDFANDKSITGASISVEFRF